MAGGSILDCARKPKMEIPARPCRPLLIRERVAAAPVLLRVCLLAWIFLPAHAQRNEQRATARTNLPVGISVVNLINASRVGKLFDTSNPTLNAYANPNTSGVTFRTSWADVEPEEGKFDFSKIDTVLANAEKNSKWVRLILVPGFGTPGWALQGVQSGMFRIPYGPGAAQSRGYPCHGIGCT